MSKLQRRAGTPPPQCGTGVLARPLPSCKTNIGESLQVWPVALATQECDVESPQGVELTRDASQKARLKDRNAYSPSRYASSSYPCAAHRRVRPLHGEPGCDRYLDRFTRDCPGSPPEPDPAQACSDLLSVDVGCFYSGLRLVCRSIWDSDRFPHGDSCLCLGISSMWFCELDSIFSGSPGAAGSWWSNDGARGTSSDPAHDTAIGVCRCPGVADHSSIDGTGPWTSGGRIYNHLFLLEVDFLD